MDDNMMKKIIEDNSKLNSMAKAILVRWKWNDNKNYRIFMGLRYGGSAETQFDLNQKYPESSEEKITLLLHSDQLATLSREEKLNKIMQLLDESMWHWEPSQDVKFLNIIDRFLGPEK